jgi:hypothetical protein
MTARKPAAGQAVFTDPDRPLLRLLNRAAGKSVLAMCGLPGSRDPAHAAAGRLPVRFHRFSDVRLYWSEFKDGCWRPDQQQRFVALILLTNSQKPIVDERSMAALMDFRGQGLPALWGEVSPEGAVMWRPEFHIAEIEVGPEFYIEGTEVGPEEGHYRWVCGSHYQLVPGPA